MQKVATHLKILRPYVMPKKPESNLIPPREWPQVIRWASVATTLIALVWVFRIDLDTMPGAMLGPTHPLRSETDGMTPKAGAPGLETWIFPIKQWEKQDSLAYTLDGILESQERVSLRAPTASPTQRFQLSLGQGEFSPPYRMLYSDDPPQVRLTTYGEWLDSLSEQIDNSQYERLRSFERFSESFLQALNDESGKYIPRYSRLFTPAAWYQSELTAWIRLAPRTSGSNALQDFSPPYGSVIGTQPKALQLKRILRFSPIFFLIALALILLYERKRDTYGILVYVAGVVGTGVWSLAIWEWLLTPFDPILWLCAPVPFLVGLSMAIRIRSETTREGIDQLYSRFFGNRFLPSLLALALLGAGGYVIGGVIGRVVLAVVGTTIAVFVSAQWCIAEDALATPRQTVLVKFHYRSAILLLGALGIVAMVIMPPPRCYDLFKPVFPAAVDSLQFIPQEPYWIGPVRESQEAELIAILQTEPGVVDFYTPAIWKLPQRTPGEREWLRNAASLGTFKNTFSQTTEDGSVLRDRILSSWLTVTDKMERYIASREDTLLANRWRYDQSSQGVVYKVTERLHGIAGNWFTREYDELNDAGVALRQVALEANSRNPLLYGGNWYDAFHRRDASSIAVVYVSSERTIDQLRERLPASMTIVGPLIYQSAELEEVFWLGLLLCGVTITVMVFHRVHWIDFATSLSGVLFAGGILSVAGASLATIGLATSIGWLLSTLLRHRSSILIFGIAYLVIPLYLAWGIAIVLIISAIVSWIGKTER
ncbi:MAG: hypothetical protein OEM52_03975 [bacterium]|nr:hypothetical protein [bacterium]